VCVYVLCHCDTLCTCFELNKLFNKFLLKYDACLYLVVDSFYGGWLIGVGGWVVRHGSCVVGRASWVVGTVLGVV
jgi:hypothetical protein